MSIKLEDLIAISVGVVLCGSVAPEILAPIRVTVSRFYNNHTKLFAPIDSTLSKSYENVKTAGEEMRKLIYHNSPLYLA